jgi:hypothetical protein
MGGSEKGPDGQLASCRQLVTKNRILAWAIAITLCEQFGPAAAAELEAGVDISNAAQEAMRGATNWKRISGQVLQATALGVLAQADNNIAFQARVNGLLALTLLLVFGTVLVGFYSKNQDWVGVVFFLLLLRADTSAALLARLARIATWSRRIRPTKVLYETDVWPLQAAALIWNDYQPLKPGNAEEDEDGILTDLAAKECTRWRPMLDDNRFFQAMKTPFWLFFLLMRALAMIGERLALVVWTLAVVRTRPNYLPENLGETGREVTGHTALLTSDQLDWLQEETMKTENSSLSRNARRVVSRALHQANLLQHSAFGRLVEHSLPDMSMNDYYKMVGSNTILKRIIGAQSVARLGLFRQLGNGNVVPAGGHATKQVLWARLVAGSHKSLEELTTWRGSVVGAVYQHQYQLKDVMASGGEPIHRHIYSVYRRWMVDLVVALWWTLEFSSNDVLDDDLVRTLLLEKLSDGQKHNTASLPHAIGEWITASARTNPEEQALNVILGVEWNTWADSVVPEAEGLTLREMAAASGEWHQYQGITLAETGVPQRLYASKSIAAVLRDNTTGMVEDPEHYSVQADLVRVTILRRVVETLVEKVLARVAGRESRLLVHQDTHGSMAE